MGQNMELSKIDALEALLSSATDDKKISIVPEYLKFEKVGDSFKGVLFSKFSRVNQETGEMQNGIQFIGSGKKVFETLSSFIVTRLSSVEPGIVVELIYKGEEKVKSGTNRKIKVFEINLFS